MKAPDAVTQNRYTEEHMKLAGQIGAVIGMVRLCGIVPMPSASVQAAMRAAGLRDSDMTNPSTAFRKRVEEQASFTGAMAELQKRQGTGEAVISSRACRNLVEMYGPEGWVRRGLVPAR